MACVRISDALAYPVHEQSWRRPTGNVDYRITNPFGGTDYLNGGKHLGVDFGNFRPNATHPGDPIVAVPGIVRARGLRHFDGALGLELDCGPLGRFLFWHLDRTLPHPVTLGASTAGSWIVPKANQQLGITGNSGAKLPSGEPMPSHTHAEYYAAGSAKPSDPAPYLLGQVITDEGAGMSAVGTGTVNANVWFRSGPSSDAPPSIKNPFPFPVDVNLVGYKADGGAYEAGGLKRTDWWYVTREEPHWVAAAFVGNRRSSLFPGDCTALQNRIDAASTALSGAEQAHTAEGAALSAARKALA